MNALVLRLLAAVIVGFFLGGTLHAAASQQSDLNASATRSSVVELAERLAEIRPPQPLAANVVQPFNPVAYNQSSDQNAGAPDQSGGALTKSGSSLPDRDHLLAIAAKIAPNGTIFVGKAPVLVIAGKFYKVGTKFTVTSGGADRIVELTAINHTSFTLRLNYEEITRPIKSTKTSP
jgi:hypothetical protein